jgi:hypothetical protein
MYFAVESALCNIKMFFMYAAFQAFLFIFKDTTFFYFLENAGEHCTSLHYRGNGYSKWGENFSRLLFPKYLIQLVANSSGCVMCF